MVGQRLYDLFADELRRRIDAERQHLVGDQPQEAAPDAGDPRAAAVHQGQRDGADHRVQAGAVAAAGEDADGVESRGDEVAAELGRFADKRFEIGREALRAAEELAHADLE